MTDFNPKEYWDSRLSQNYSLKGVGDIGLPVSYNKFLYYVRSSAFQYAMKSIEIKGSKKDLKVLDIGSGTGFYIDQWQRQGVSDISGSDITDTAVTNLKEKYPEFRFINQDVGGQLDDELLNNKVDVVSAFDMLFHIVDDKNYAQAIENFSQLVKINGYLIFSDNLSPSKKISLEHQVSRTEKEVFCLLEKKGFEFVKTIPMFVFMNDPVRSENRFLRKLFSKIYQFASKGENYGRVIGCLLYPLEIIALRLLKRGPSTEIFVWRRIN